MGNNTISNLIVCWGAWQSNAQSPSNSFATSFNTDTPYMASANAGHASTIGTYTFNNYPYHISINASGFNSYSAYGSSGQYIAIGY